MAALPKGSGPMAPNRPLGAHGLAPWARLWIEGLKTALCFEGTLNGEVFLFFLRHFLLPLLHPGDLVLLDNAKAHHVEQVRELIEQAGAQVVYLPPYSPDLNPIELAWSKVKHWPRAKRKPVPKRRFIRRSPRPYRRSHLMMLGLSFIMSVSVFEPNGKRYIN